MNIIIMMLFDVNDVYEYLLIIQCRSVLVVYNICSFTVDLHFPSFPSPTVITPCSNGNVPFNNFNLTLRLHNF